MRRVISLSSLAWKETIWPRYIYSWTYSISPLFTHILRFALLVMTLVFDMFISSPTPKLAVLRSSNIWVNSEAEDEKRMMSSAKRRLVNLLSSTRMPLSVQLAARFLKTSSNTAVNSFGDRGSPCLTPFSILNDGPVVWSLIAAVLFLYMFYISHAR